MVSLECQIPVAVSTDPNYWVNLLKALATVSEYLNRIAEGHYDEEVFLSAADCIECEMQGILRRAMDLGVDLPAELNPIVWIEENGATVKMHLGDYISLHEQSADTSLIN
jgi:hypothetical protein